MTNNLTVSYPYGRGSDNQTVRNIIKQWYVMARGVLPGALNLTNADRYNLYAREVFLGEPIETFAGDLKANSPLTILFYHHVCSSSVSLEDFDAQMHYLKDQNFTVLTLKQAFLSERSEYISPDNYGPLVPWRFR